MQITDGVEPHGSEHEARIVEVDPVADPRWDAFVRRSATTTFYHLSAWIRVLRETYGYRVHCLMDEAPDGAVYGVLPLMVTGNALLGRKLLSLPFSDSAGPDALSRESFIRLIGEAIRLQESGRFGYLQLRSHDGNLSAMADGMTDDRRYVDFRLTLSKDLDSYWTNSGRAKLRTHIRKAIKDRVTVHLGTSERDLRDFYDLHLLTTKKHGMPAQSYGYFRNLSSILRPHCDVRLLIARLDDRPVAASLFVGFGDSVIYLYNASNPRALELRPNHLILWEAIKWASESGYHSFGFGKTSVDNAGLVAFKQAWGAEEVPLHYYYFPRMDGLTSSEYSESKRPYRLVTGLWRTLPAPLTNPAGAILYRYLA
jgi:FemAB-related protein (PEP-CTERM system-associated)